MNVAKVFGLALVALLLIAFSTQAGENPRFSLGDGMIHGGNTAVAKAGNDTINLMAAANDPTNNTNPGPCSLPEPIYRADFEMGANGGRVETDGSGWSSRDLTTSSASHWHVSDFDGFGTPYGNYRAWCGDPGIPSCGPDDPVGGYGNHWHDQIAFTVAVANPAVGSGVEISASLQHDSEPGYDYTYLSYRYENQGLADVASWDGQSQVDGVFGPIEVTESLTYLPGEYVDGTNITVVWRFRSDGIWSDEDCFFASAGGCLLDDVNVRITNDGTVANFFEDFEHGGDPGNLGIWEVIYPTGVGDFARIYRGLEDADPCHTNYTAQVAFIDDGVAVPGTGGSWCINWCYGPGGYIVTTTGGLAGEMEHIHNAIESPVMDWPQAKDCVSQDPDGILLEFDVYKHEDLTADAPGIFFTWGVRSADTDGSAGQVQVITGQPWRDRNFVYFGGPSYIRKGDDVTDLMNSGRDEVQVQLAVYELGFLWGWTGDDGYPAPYFDNVTVKVFPVQGPSISAREMDLAQDNFPKRETIDYDDLGSNSVRFDMANNISWAFHMRNDPGDSIVVDVVPVRAGSELVGVPTLHYLLEPNPVFTPAMRTAGLPDKSSVPGMPAVGISGQVAPDKWAFDLPDTGFLFPGDVLHYFIGATDDVAGHLQSNTLPADTTGFSTSHTGNPLGYPSSFTVRALPTISNDGFGGFAQAELLFINDFGGRGGENKWYIALSHIGLLLGEDYDAYYVNAPGSGVGNGIGGRANAQLLADYSDIFYTCGDLSRNTISNGDFQNDAGDDVGTLSAWLDQGRKDILLTGDNLASDLAQSGQATLSFLQDKMGLSLVTNDLRPFIGNQTSPLVQPTPDNPVFFPGWHPDTWIAFGGCPTINTFDGVETLGGGQRLAEFMDPSGWGYQYSAATLNILNPGSNQSRVISMPVDLMYVYTDPNAGGNLLPARARLLDAFANFFGFVGDIVLPSAVDLPGVVFATSNAPNPFNPSTTIKYSLPKAGHLKLSVYNVRGQLVKTLIDGPRPAGANQTVVWDGKDNLGTAASSGIYFYEARAAGELRVGKMTLLK